MGGKGGEVKEGTRARKGGGGWRVLKDGGKGVKAYHIERRRRGFFTN